MGDFPGPPSMFLSSSTQSLKKLDKYGEKRVTYAEHKLIRCATIISPITIVLMAGPMRLNPKVLKETESAIYAWRSQVDLVPFRLDETGILQFYLDPVSAQLIITLRQKWQSLLLRRLKNPGKPGTPQDEAVLSALVTVLTSEEQVLGLRQPSGVGARPRPMAVELCNQVDCSFPASTSLAVDQNSSHSGAASMMGTNITSRPPPLQLQSCGGSAFSIPTNMSDVTQLIRCCGQINSSGLITRGSRYHDHAAALKANEQLNVHSMISANYPDLESRLNHAPFQCILSRSEDGSDYVVDQVIDQSASHQVTADRSVILK
ncbi:uncharacterized protein DEA37_0004115 [Paragonimus westermani]|uniref:Uncharacterized protein n=1 Tax=Paragonimus westermani TaxID=34504 RepID=A0A5J4NKX7_9TREM|nr:uncharacterized protein DEA37_0004115 [Paragonimus westermani]